ncbi:MAG: helix-turn-helix transcriptional regulator [Vulcanimicrobiaceae bacterium]
MVAGPVSCPVFVGRARELAALQTARRGLARSRGGVVLVGGEAGIGKSRLLGQVLASLRRDPRPRFLASAECVKGLERPLGPFRELVSGLGGTAFVDEYPPSVARALAHLAVPRTPRGELPRLEKGELFAGVEGFLRAVAARRATILTIEDLHWADRSSLELLAFLAPRVAGTRLLVVATYRIDELEARGPLRAALAQLSRAATVTGIALEALATEETQALIEGALAGRALLSPQRKRDVAVRSGGNPFFAEELLKDALEARDDARATSLPLSIRSSIGDRLALFAPHEQRIVAHAAVLGYRFDPALLALTLESELDSVLPTLRRGRDLNVFVEERSDPVRVRFRHPLMRQAAYDGLLHFDARATHERILRTLESLDPGERHLEALAYHAQAAGDAAKTLLYNERAGKAALDMRALPEARSFFECALAAAPERAQRAALLEQIGLVAELEGAIGEALKRLEAALAGFLDLGEFDRAADVVRAIAGNRNNLGDRTAVAFGIRFLDEYGSRVQVGARDALLSLLARLATILHEAPQARELLARIERPESLPPRPLQNYLTAKMDLAFFSGDVAAWSELAQRLSEVIRELPPFLALIALYALAQNASLLGLGDLADRSFARADLIEEQWEFGALRAHGAALRALHAYQYGRLARARAHIEATLRGSEAKVAQDALELVMPLVALAVGDPGLISPAQEADMIERRREAGNVDDARLLAVDAALKVARGHPKEARADLRRAISIVLRADPSCGTLVLLAAEHLEERDLQPLRALTEADRYLACDLAGRTNATLANAIVERRCGDERLAVALASEAAAGYRTLGWPLFEARALEICGDLEAARALYARSGASADVARLEGPGRARASGLAAKLSERERAIARLIAQGRSNAAIGENLAISVKTVEKHIASIFEKLDVRKRAQIAAAFASEESRESS